MEKHLLSWLPFSNWTHSLQSPASDMHSSVYLKLEESSEAQRGPHSSRERPRCPQVRYSVTQVPLSQTQLFSRLLTAFKDTFKRSPELERTQQAALSVNEIASHEFECTKYMAPDNLTLL